MKRPDPRAIRHPRPSPPATFSVLPAPPREARVDPHPPRKCAATSRGGRGGFAFHAERTPEAWGTAGGVTTNSVRDCERCPQMLHLRRPMCPQIWRRRCRCVYVRRRCRPGPKSRPALDGTPRHSHSIVLARCNMLIFRCKFLCVRISTALQIRQKSALLI